MTMSFRILELLRPKKKNELLTRVKITDLFGHTLNGGGVIRCVARYTR